MSSLATLTHGLTRSLVRDLPPHDWLSVLRAQGEPSPPGPGNVMAGLFRGEQTNFLRFLEQLHANHGDVARFDVGPIAAYGIFHPDDVEAILVGCAKDSLKDRLTHDLELFLGQGLVTAEGEPWRRHRKLAAPSFARRQIERYAAAMVDRAERVAASWRDGELRPMHVDMMALTLDIVLVTIFGEDSEVDHHAIGEALDVIMDGTAQRLGTWRRLLPTTLPTRWRAKMDRAAAVIDATVFRLIEERRALLARDPAAAETRTDLLTALLTARDDEGRPMDARQLRDEVATIFLAGHETTALALAYSLHLLARNPATQRALHAELDRVVGDRSVTLADLPALPYADAVVREAMRLLPPVWSIGRELQVPVRVRDWTLPAGATVIFSQWVTHHDPRWFPAPAAFRPERWLEQVDGKPLAQRLPKFAYFPFGGGPRVCIGNYFAQMEAVLCLAAVAQRFTVEGLPGFELGLLPSVTLRPTRGVPLRVHERRRSA